MINKAEEKLEKREIKYEKIYACDGERIKVKQGIITYLLPEHINLL